LEYRFDLDEFVRIGVFVKVTDRMSSNLTQVRYFELHPSQDAPFVQLSKTGKIFVTVPSISTSLLELVFL
jgi:hypothetical protein